MSTRPARLPGRVRGRKKRTTQMRSYESPVIQRAVRSGTTSGGTAAIAMLVHCLKDRGQSIERALAHYEAMGTKMQRRYLASAAKSGALAEWMTRRGFDVHLIDWLLAPAAETTP